MIKKEISEIKKLFKPEASTISKMAGCYVNAEKEKVATIGDNFLALPEEQSFKYFEIFSKCLSGTVGKNLINMDFPINSEEEGGTQEFILKLRNSGLKEPELLEQFYDKVIETYDYVGNYLILLVHAVYDVPGKASDGSEMDDASEEIYEHILCCICPVDLDKAALSFDAGSGNFMVRERDWIVDPPMNGFLFPAFNDRSADIHSVLYYAKKPDDVNQTFVDEVLGATMPLTAGIQKDSFKALLEEGLEEECSYELVRNIQERVNEIVEEAKENPEPVILDKEEVLHVLSDSGVSQEKIDNFEKKYDDEIGEDATLQATNIVDTTKMKVKTTAVEIKCKAEDIALLETKIIDGRRCIIIPLDNGVEINGIKVIPGAIEED